MPIVISFEVWPRCRVSRLGEPLRPQPKPVSLRRAVMLSMRIALGFWQQECLPHTT